MTPKEFLGYFNIAKTDIQFIETIRDFEVQLHFGVNYLKHHNMDSFLGVGEVNSFSVENNVLKIYIK